VPSVLLVLIGILIVGATYGGHITPAVGSTGLFL
jgi:hypothetical protein